MAINFPDSPSIGDTHTSGGRTWTYDGTGWVVYGPSIDATVLRIDSGNNRVGINNASPTVTLDVTGDVNISGELTSRGYRYVDTVYFTSSGTFTKASYPWLRAIRVTAQAGGGGGGHADTTGAGQISVGGGGGAGTWAQSFITDIASLAASVTVTVGAAGNGGLYATSTAATAGGDSSFGSGAAYEVSAGGGGGGTTITRSGASTGVGGAGGGGGVGDIYIRGGGGFSGTATDSANAYSGTGGKGASSLLGNSGRDARANQGAGLSEGYGAGGTGYARVENLTGVDGRDGTAGIVIVELYA